MIAHCNPTRTTYARLPTIYLFQSGETDRYALSIDKTGCNVPLSAPAWLLRGELDADELPDDIGSTEGTSKLHFRWQERVGH